MSNAFYRFQLLLNCYDFLRVSKLSQNGSPKSELSGTVGVQLFTSGAPFLSPNKQWHSTGHDWCKDLLVNLQSFVIIKQPYHYKQ